MKQNNTKLCLIEVHNLRIHENILNLHFIILYYYSLQAGN